MLSFRWLLVVVVSFFCLQVEAQKLAPLSIEKIMRDPKMWIGTSPSNISWSADSQKIYFSWNPEKNLADSLYSYSLDNQQILKVTKSERQTLHRDPGRFNKDFSLKVYEMDGDIYLLDCKTFMVKPITETVAREQNPVFSADGEGIYFLQENNVFYYGLKTGNIRSITNIIQGEKKEAKKRGTQENWLRKDQLEMFEVLKERKAKTDATTKAVEAEKKKLAREIYIGSKRPANLTVSPDGKFVAYSLVEAPKNSQSTVVPNYVTESGFTENIPARTKVGAPAASYEFWVYDIAQDTVRKLSVKEIPGITDKPEYLKDYPSQDSLSKMEERKVIVNGPVWSESGKYAIVVIKSLDNKDRWIMQLDPGNMSLKLLDRQRDEAWIGGPNVGGYFMSTGVLEWIDDQNFYYQSEATGYSHLYKHNIVTETKTALTSGKFEIQQVSLSKDRKNFYVIANKVHPGEQHYYKLSVDGGEMIQLTQGTGAHEVTLSPDEKYLAIRYSNSNTPWELYLQENRAGAEPKKITLSTTDEFRSYPWRTPIVTTIPARDGEPIFARLYKPAKANGKAVIFVHGAGYLQNAHKWWSTYFREYMFHNMLTDLGYTVLDIDYRGSAGYGRDWRTGIYRFMGGKDLDDHEDAAKWLAKNYKVNASKIGIYGGSYGGFITLMAMFTKPDLFKAGAALRPVTDWAAYNHPYTSNILNEPQSDSIAYRKSSPIYHAAGLSGHLLICHGVVDVNVHFQDVMRLSQRLIELGKDNWEVAAYPMEDHGFVEPSSWTDEYKRIFKLFEERLK